MMGSLERINSDPFIPLNERNKLAFILDKRISSTFEAYHKAIENYQDDLCKGKGWETFYDNKV